MRIWLLLLLLVSHHLLASSKPHNSNIKETQYFPAISDFAKDDVWSNVQISPTGQYFSAVSHINGKKVIVLLDAKTLKPLHKLQFNGYEQPGNYAWTNDERIIVSKQYLRGWSDFPTSAGELYAVNTNGHRSKYIFGYQNASKNATKRMGGYILDPMPEDEQHMLVYATEFSRTVGKVNKARVYRTNVYTGSIREIAQAPVKYAQFITDHNHKLRFVSGLDDDNQRKSYLFKGEQWHSTANLNISNDSFKPIAILADTNKLYATYALNGEPASLYLFDLDSGEKELIYQSTKVEIDRFKMDDTGYIYAIELYDGKENTKILDEKHIDAKQLSKIQKKLSKYSFSIVSETTDGNSKVIFAYNDSNPGSYLLYNVATDLLTSMFSKRPWVDSKQTASVIPFNFKSRDGITISAYITLPANADIKNLPFVVNVHGGPHGVRDYPGYNRETQLYASQGIAVLQVNYRGSGGFGLAFEELGYQHWGDTVQYDIIDGIKTLIKEGIADENRLCIVGGSFGGYSALQTVLLEPDLFQCAVGIAGVYDLKLIHEVGDIQQRSAGRDYLAEVIGNDETQLKSFSPIYNLKKLKASVLIIHGGEDKRVPIEHAEKLKTGLAKQNIQHEWMVFDEEGHGFYKPEHRAAVFERTLNFLNKHLNL